MALCEAGSGSSPDTGSSGILTLDLPDARTLRSGFLLLSHPVHGILSLQPEHTEMVVGTTFPPYPHKCHTCSDHQRSFPGDQDTPVSESHHGPSNPFWLLLFTSLGIGLSPPLHLVSYENFPDPATNLELFWCFGLSPLHSLTLFFFLPPSSLFFS